MQVGVRFGCSQTLVTREARWELGRLRLTTAVVPSPKQLEILNVSRLIAVLFNYQPHELSRGTNRYDMGTSAQ